MVEKNTYERCKVRCVETGEVYESLSAAAYAVGCTRGTMSNHLNGRFPHVRGKHFERINETEEE